MPDPSFLTTAQILREVTMLKENIEVRLDAMDKAMKLFQDNLTRVPTDVDKQVGNLKELHNTRFEGIEMRIAERDDQLKEAKTDAKIGIDAALASAEKLVSQNNIAFKEMFEKAEASTGKLLEKQDENHKNTTTSLEDQITGLKERVDRFDGIAAGMAAQTANQRQGTGQLIAIIGSIMAFVGLLVTLAVVFSR